MKLTPQQNQILNMHEDGQWHCPTKELYMKDDRKRYSELRQKGYVFESIPCNLGHNHNSGVFMRRLIGENPLNLTQREILPENEPNLATGQTARKNIGQNLHPIFQKALFPYQPKYH